MTSTSQIQKDHPAKYSKALIPEMVQMLRDLGVTSHGRHGRLLDPMAGTGRAGLIATELGLDFTGVELEPEWSIHHPDVLVGDATALPFADDVFEAIVVSPAYGNRMADAYAGSPTDRAHLMSGAKRMRRLTYRISLGRPLSANSGAGMQWGKEYRRLHQASWTESARVLRPGGAFVLNIKNHLRAGKRCDVSGWHCDNLISLGFQLVFRSEVATTHYQQGANRDKRLPELVIGFIAPANAELMAPR